MKPVEIIEAAAEFLEANPEKWTVGTTKDGDGNMCLLGVMAHVSGVKLNLADPRPMDREPSKAKAGKWKDFQRARDILGLSLIDRGVVYENCDPVTAVYYYNDNDNVGAVAIGAGRLRRQNPSELIEALRITAKDLRNEATPGV